MGNKTYVDGIRKALGDSARVLHYTLDFDKLWSDAFDPGEAPVVIVWERGPSGGSSDPDDRLLEPHVTPLDWALAWSLRRAEAGQNIPAIAIIDARIDDWGGGWSWQVRRQLLADMPWVTLAATVVRPDGASYLHRPVLVSPDGSFGGLLVRSDDRWSMAMDWTPRRIADKEYRALRMLSRLWAASLNESDEHHDINNIVGARILLSAARDDLAHDPYLCGKAASPTALAFLQKVEWCQKATSEPTKWEIWRNERTKRYLFEKPVVVSLYDDMHATGWGGFLFDFLRNLDPEMHAQATPAGLLSFLSKRAVFEKRDFIQNVVEEKNGHPEIIFLDFRLYPRANRAEFLNDTETLIELAEGIAGSSTLAWDSITQSEIDDLKGWLSRGAPEAEHWHDQSLLLLPRLLALALPLTPIILFSSTAQARIREQLKPYRNIFTGFQKPNPLGNPASIELAITALGNAMDRAMPMLRRRLQLAHCQTIFDEFDRLRESRVIGGQHVEVYFDEAGTHSQGLYSVATVASFQSKEAAAQVNKSLVDNIFNNLDGPIDAWTSVRDLSILTRGTGFAERLNGLLDSAYKEMKKPEIEALSKELSSLFFNEIKNDFSKPVFNEISSYVNNPAISNDKSLRKAIRKFSKQGLSRIFDDFRGESVGIPKFKKFSEITDAETASKQIELLKGQMKDKVVFPAILAAKCDNRKIESGLAGFEDMALDEGIRLNIDLVFGCFLDYHFPDGATVSIYLPTRTGAKTTDGFLQRFGAPYGKDTAFPLIRGWLQQWGNASKAFAYRLHSARSRQLAGGRGLTPAELENGRVLHDVGDWGAGIVYAIEKSTHKQNTVNPEFFEKGHFTTRYLSDIPSGNFRNLRDSLSVFLSNDREGFAQAIYSLCGTKLLDECRPKKSADYTLSENLWLWAIFPRISNGTNGDHLTAGL